MTVNVLGTPATITNPSTADCTGGTIQNATSTGISLTSTQDVSLTRMYILNSDDIGIFGDEVTNFSLISSFVSGSGDDPAGQASAEAGIRFDELYGSAALTNSAIGGADSYNNMYMTPSSGTLTNLSVTGTNFAANDPNFGNNGLLLLADGTANATVTIDNSAFTTVRASGLQVSQTGSGLVTALVSDTSFTNGNIATDLGHAFSGDLTFNVSRNTYVGNDSNVINFSASSTSTNNGDVNGLIDNNRIGNGTLDSGSRDAFGIGIDAIGDVDMVLSITNNVVRNTDMAGIFAESAFDQTSGGEKGLFDLTLRDNDVGTPDDNSAFPFFTVFGTRVERGTTAIYVWMSLGTRPTTSAASATSSCDSVAPARAMVPRSPPSGWSGSSATAPT